MTRLVFIIGSALAFFVPSTLGFGPGSNIPDVALNWGFNPVTKVFMPEYTSKQNVVILGVPGAFLPTETEIQIPTYFEKQDLFRQAGIDNIIVYSVNDSAVVGIWNKQLVEAHGKQSNSGSNNKNGNIITFMADPTREFTQACGMELTDPRPATNGLVGRCKRFAMYVVNNVVQNVVVSENYDDPTGDKDPTATCADAILYSLKTVQNQGYVKSN